nr:RNA-directed DNA polymerase, eukaryota [Tanacetum cinerariifolium]
TKNTILKDLVEIDKNLDEGANPDELFPTRTDLNRKLYEINQMDLKDVAQIRWAIEGDENSKFFHGVINKRRSHLAIRRVFASGDWFVDPSTVKEAFRDHFALLDWIFVLLSNASSIKGAFQEVTTRHSSL